MGRVNNNEPDPGQVAFLDLVREQPKKSVTTPWYESIPNAALKGTTEGLIQFGEAMTGRGGLGLKSAPEISEKGKKERKSLYEEHLPSEGFAANVVERGTKLFPSLAGGGGGAVSSALRAGGAGILGEGAKELGFGETGQTIAELPFLIGPELIKTVRNVLPTMKASQQQKLIDFARQKGMTEEELTLALGQRGWLRDFFTDISSKGGRGAERFQKTRAAFNRVYDTLRGSPVAQTPLDPNGVVTLETAIRGDLRNMPAGARNQITEDLNDLLGSNFTGEDIMNFWADINYNHDEKILGILKPHLQKALNSINPQLGQDFAMTNQLFKNYADLAGRMRPDLAEHLIKGGERGALISGITTGNYKLLKNVLGPIAARQIAQEMIINPRLQNMSSRLLAGLQKGSLAASQEAYDQFISELSTTDQELANKMSEIEMSDFLKEITESESSRNKQKK